MEGQHGLASIYLLGEFSVRFESPVVIGHGTGILLLSVAATTALLVTIAILVRRALRHDFQWSDWVCVASFCFGLTWNEVMIPLAFFALLLLLPFRSEQLAEVEQP